MNINSDLQTQHVEDAPDRQALLRILIEEQRQTVSSATSDLADSWQRYHLRRVRLEVLAKHGLSDDLDDVELETLLEVVHDVERQVSRQQRILAALEAEV